MTLSSIESAYAQEIELGSTELVLFAQQETEHVAIPSTISFAIALPQDTPQSIQTPFSFLKHTLIAVLHPLDPSEQPVKKSSVVHTKRFISHLHAIAIAPRTFTLENPTRVEVQIPRDIFLVGESIPVYVTIPPPRRELVVDEGLRLRSVRVEMVKVTKVLRTGKGGEGELDQEMFLNEDAVSLVPQNLLQPSTSRELSSPFAPASSYREVVARSGASCRFHSSRPIQLRFVLHQPSPSGSPLEQSSQLDHGFGYINGDLDSISITQRTLLHSITFRVNVHISFVNVTNRTERIPSITIPIIISPPPAPLPEVDASFDQAYQKKHDRPPVKTNRQDDNENNMPHYIEGEAGPSMSVVAGAPPPFEEPEAPPPFFLSASTSNHLPSFLESENEIIIPEHSAAETAHHGPQSPVVIGEGTVFGFPASQQFDGHSEDLQPLTTPPPTVEMASHDTDLTALVDTDGPDRAIGILGLVLEQHDAGIVSEQPPPPPPPALDDPSDPPPSIDSEFRTPEGARQPSPSRSPPLQIPSYHLVDLPIPPAEPLLPPVDMGIQQIDGHAPPPYLIPESNVDTENVARPPPYVD